MTVLEIIQRAGMQLGIGVAVANASSESEIDAAFGKLSRERADGVFVMERPFFFTRRQAISARVAAARIPAIYPNGAYVDAGGGDGLRRGLPALKSW